MIQTIFHTGRLLPPFFLLFFLLFLAACDGGARFDPSFEPKMSLGGIYYNNSGSTPATISVDLYADSTQVFDFDAYLLDYYWILEGDTHKNRKYITLPDYGVEKSEARVEFHMDDAWGFSASDSLAIDLPFRAKLVSPAEGHAFAAGDTARFIFQSNKQDALVVLSDDCHGFGTLPRPQPGFAPGSYCWAVVRPTDPIVQWKIIRRFSVDTVNP
jgi:hypothetical protein